MTAILTKSAEEFITKLTISSLTGRETYSELFSLKDETEMGHIRLSREADLILVAPASCNIIAKMAGGFADDLASSVLLANDKPLVITPAMNILMWKNKAVQRNMKLLENDGIRILGPTSGKLACGEEGFGRMIEPDEIVKYISNIV